MDGKAAVALPVQGVDGAVRAVVGLAWLDERGLTQGELEKLEADAASLPAVLPVTEMSVPRPRQSND
ncbi:hypothetical protein ABT167_37970 [Streptomyces sp. NPDC001792]|uniref:hypothetical protein n=1 Tax=Streptomyces sp. NPDC001792 TaxID=3154524 RepID=UPI0033262F9E